MSLGAITEVTVASRDVDRAIEFHRQAFDFDVLGADEAGALVGVPGIETGLIRFVEADADPVLPAPVQWATGARLLQLQSRDLPRTRAAVEEAGGSSGTLVTYTNIDASEFAAYGPDEVTWMITGALDRHPTRALTADPGRRDSELHSVGLVVADIDAMLDLFADAGGMRILVRHPNLTGTEIENVLGLPAGAALGTALLGDADNWPVRLELLQFSNVPPAEPYERPVGVTRITFGVDDRDALQATLVERGATILEPGLLLGPGRLEIELRER